MIELTEENEFSAFKSIASLLAYAAHKDGLDFVRQLLTMLDLPRESLAQAAATVAALGIHDLAKLIRSAARKARPMRIEELPFDQRMAARRLAARKGNFGKPARRPTG